MRFQFRQFVNTYEKPVYSMAMHVLRNREEAEDVTQEVFTKLWRNMDNLDLSKVKPWLLTVTKNMCIDHIRKRKDEQEYEDNDFVCENPEWQPAQALRESRLSDWLREAIDRLKEPHKSLIVMSDVKQMSQKEIAGILELSVTQVKVYLHRARQKLRSHLQEVHS